MEEINDHAEQDILKIIVGNKTDLEADRIVSASEGEQLAKHCSSAFMEISALKNINVDEVFTTIAKEIYEYVKENERQESIIASRNTYNRSTLINHFTKDKKKS